jgi:hypothetical protein
MQKELMHVIDGETTPELKRGAKTIWIYLCQTKSYLFYYWHSERQFALVSGTDLEPITRFLILSDIWGFSCGVSSLKSGWVCSLQLLLGLIKASFSGLSPAELTSIFYCLKFKTPPTWKNWFLYLHPPKKRVAQFWAEFKMSQE